MTDLIAEACTKAHDHGFEKGSALGIQVSMAWLDANGYGFLAEGLSAASVAGDLEQYRSLPQPGTAEPAPVVTHHPMLTDISPTDIDPLPALKISVEQAKGSGYTGNECTFCHGMRMTISGHCEKCEDCGESSGCS